jgi:hypothetical protein
MAEWFKALVLKTRDRKVRGFESYSLRHSEFSVFCQNINAAKCRKFEGFSSIELKTEN